MVIHLLHEPLPYLFSGLTRQKVAVDFGWLSALLCQAPKAARIHDHRTTDPKVGPEQASSPMVDCALLHHCGELHLMRETGERLVKHGVGKHQRHQCRGSGGHLMAKTSHQLIAESITA